jgi:hypothetical protein
MRVDFDNAPHIVFRILEVLVGEAIIEILEHGEIYRERE